MIPVVTLKTRKVTHSVGNINELAVALSLGAVECDDMLRKYLSGTVGFGVRGGKRRCRWGSQGSATLRM